MVHQFAHAFNDPFFIGFDRLVNRLERASKPVDNYPPFNILCNSEDQFTIEMAVAGFTEEDIDITYKDSTLTITANAKEEKIDYLHRGVAKRGFTRKFNLADTIEVKGADLKNGMLLVDLENIIPEEKKARKIPLGSKQTLLSE